MVKLFLIIVGLLRVAAGFQIFENDKHPDARNNNDLNCRVYQGDELNEVKCNNVDMHNIQEFFENNKKKLNGSIFLYIINGVFPKNKLPAYWIKGNFKITKLFFENCFSLQEIEPFAFNSSTFQNLETLRFDNAKINNLDNNSFVGLYSLKNLIIKNKMKLVAESILEPISKTLMSFKYQQYDETDNINLFKLLSTRSFMLNLTYLDYDVDKLDEIIDKDTFSHALNLKQIMLHNHGMDIKSGAFDDLAESLEYLTLAKNNIYIPDGLFEKFIKKIKFINIHAENLECNCKLLYLADVYEKYPNKFDKQNMLCFSHGSKKDIKIVLEYCSHTTANSSILTTEPSIEASSQISTNSMVKTSSDSTTSLTTPVYNSLIKIDCSSNCSNCIDNMSAKNILEIKEADIDFHLLTKDSNGVQLYLSEFIENFDIVWFSNDTITQDRLELFYTEDNPTIQDLGCGLGINCKTVTIDELQFNTTYTFCLVKRGENEISPFNCRSHFIGNSTFLNIDDNNEDFLIPCDLELLTLILLSFGIFLAAVFGALAAFCIIRKKPSLLKGSRRVVFIQKSDKRASSSMETGFSNISTISNNRPSAQRRNSDSSIESGRSYILPSNFYEAIQYKQRIDLEKKEKVYFDKFPTNSPPPLPKRLSK